MSWPSRVRPGFVAALTVASGAAAYVVTGSIGVRGGGMPSMEQRVRRAVGVSIAGATAVGAFHAARAEASSRLEGGGRAIEPGFATPPALETVSGGPGSLVDFTTVGREGARFVGSSVPADVVERVTGSPMTMPGVRVFVGYDSAGTPEERVALALAELRRTGAYDRSTLLIGAPAGSGYANPTPVDILEILRRRRCP